MYKLEESQRIRAIEQRFGAPIRAVLYEFHWDEHLRHRELGELLDVPRSTITKWFAQLGIPTQSCRRFTDRNLPAQWERYRAMGRARRARECARRAEREKYAKRFSGTFFDIWTEEMAYVLGFLFADGYVYANPRGSQYIAFTSVDREIIEKIRAILGSNHRIGIRKRQEQNPKWKQAYVLQIGNKRIIESLQKRFGIIQNKSLVIQFPKNIPTMYLRHFVRGYFDGDGCVSFCTYVRRNRSNKLYTQLHSKFTSGSKVFLRGLHCQLRDNGIVVGGSLFRKQKGGFDLAFGIRDSIALFDFMYNNVAPEQYLERKFNAFQEAIGHWR